MCGICGTYRRDKKYTSEFGRENGGYHHFENRDGSIISKWIFKKYCGRRGLDWYGSEFGQVEGFCEHGKETSSSRHLRERRISSLAAELQASQALLHRVSSSQSRTGFRYMRKRNSSYDHKKGGPSILPILQNVQRFNSIMCRCSTQNFSQIGE